MMYWQNIWWSLRIKRGGLQYYIHPRIPQRIITSMLASPFLLTPIKAISSFYHPLITSFPYGAEIIKRIGLGCDNNGCTDIDTICPKPFCYACFQDKYCAGFYFFSNQKKVHNDSLCLKCNRIASKLMLFCVIMSFNIMFWKRSF